MSKNGVRGVISLTIFFFVFNLVAFVIPISKTATFWIAYAFGVISIVFQVYVFKISFSDNVDAKSRFYGLPIARIGVLYLMAQMTMSIIQFIFAAYIPFWITVIVNSALLAAMTIGCIAAEAMRDEIAVQDIKLKKDVSNMRALQSLSASLVGLSNDENLKAHLQKLADEFKYSDPVSSEPTMEIENELKVLLYDEQKAVLEEDVENAKAICTKIIPMLVERNRICAMHK